MPLLSYLKVLSKSASLEDKKSPEAHAISRTLAFIKDWSEQAEKRH